MTYPYLLSSDQHAHDWSAFSHPGPDGVNNRLTIIHDEMKRSADRLIAEGGHLMVLAGDLFHVRGQIKPTVYNPTVACFRDMLEKHADLEIEAIPGNHDLEGKDCSALGNAMQGLDSLDGFTACTEIKDLGGAIVFPWFQDLNELRAALKKHADPNKDAVIHAPVNGVIKGIPDHGLEARELADMGYRRVFAGHYHNHVVFEGGKVVSIGATTHQTWSDPGTRAGFLLVWEDRIEFVESLAPKFVDLTNEVLAENALKGIGPEELVRGNYVRVKLNEVTEKEIKAWREDILKDGALDCVILATKKSTATARTGAGATAAVSLNASVEYFVRENLKPLLVDEVSKEAQETLAEAM